MGRTITRTTPCAPHLSEELIMTDHDRIHDEVRAKYASAALAVDAGQANCCPSDSGDCFGAGLYDGLEQLPAAAVTASLGCGNPTAVIDLPSGATVLDLGSGGGIDVLLSARRVGEAGFVYGLDMTPEMLDLARRNAAEAGVSNVEFLLGQIEAIPLPEASIDVIISNCVINLSPDKPVVFAEMHRVLRSGGRVGLSDVVTDDSLSDDERMTLSAEVGCVAGALDHTTYELELRRAGFVDVSITFTHDVGPGVHGAIIRATKPNTAVSIRPMTEGDWPEVRAIYEAGIATGNATFETSAPSWDSWNDGHLPDHRFVAVASNGSIAGWTATSPVSDRCAYAGVVEHSVYIRPDHQGRGVGSALLRALIESAEKAGIWTIQSGIFPENIASLVLHAGCGFRVIGRRERIGQLDGVWRDTLLVERRSQRIG